MLGKNEALWMVEDPRQVYYRWLFLVQVSGGWRLMINLSILNSCHLCQMQDGNGFLSLKGGGGTSDVLHSPPPPPSLHQCVFPGVGWAHRRGIQLPYYLIDWLVTVESGPSLLEHHKTLLWHCKDLGNVINLRIQTSSQPTRLSISECWQTPSKRGSIWQTHTLPDSRMWTSSFV